MTNPRETYPAGVSCFIDTERTDVDAAMTFYGGLFGWSYKEVTPSGAPRFALAQLQGLDVAGIGAASNGAPAAWNTSLMPTPQWSNSSRASFMSETTRYSP